jgi:hypothetical protein
MFEAFFLPGDVPALAVITESPFQLNVELFNTRQLTRVSQFFDFVVAF